MSHAHVRTRTPLPAILFSLLPGCPHHCFWLEPPDEEEAGPRDRRSHAVSVREEALQRKRIPQVARTRLSDDALASLAARLTPLLSSPQLWRWGSGHAHHRR